ncbi:MAG TPA: hypothetical protein DEF88_14525 [Porphyromonadaceae bacterium]|nr:hypothetical protein [Porphyromonadaceae bacterium]HBK33343.1 hypothetical protein [Porphyromonadaceae bacterium]HBX21652.1 hypothetical protein [Porphyromonadaceae bacterium]HCM22582.1 hypothetical protein [Porphyromonadaceae bacterium]
MHYLSNQKVAIKVQKNQIEMHMGEILTKYGERGKLAKLFNVSEVTVRNALKGRTRSELSDRIRKAALERGGSETDSTKDKLEHQ